MAVSAQFLQFALDQLGAVEPVRSRRMFGGVGFYARDLFFALADNDTLYFKVDERTRPAFVREGMQPFQPFGPETAPMNGYYELPPRLLEDADELALWMRTALGVAAAAKTAGAAKPKLRRSRRTGARPRKSTPSPPRPRTSRGR